MTPSLASRLSAKRAYLLLGLAVLVLDQWSKWWIETRMAYGDVIQIVPGLVDFIRVDNTGVAFGLFAAGSSALGVAALAALGLAGFGLLAYYFARTPPEEPLLLTALALILGGAVGNLADRLASGAVTDFVDVYVGSWHWYTFNVADSGITVGVVLMTWEMLFGRQHRPAEDAP